MSISQAMAPMQPTYLPSGSPWAFPYQFHFAGLMERFAAALLDGLVLLAVVIVVSIPLGILVAVTSLSLGSAAWLASLLYGPLTLLLFVGWILYFTYFEGTSGQTLGKRALGLRVVSSRTGQPPDLGHAFLRSILRIVDWLPAFYLLGFLIALVSSRKQRLGDHLADTIVVKM